MKCLICKLGETRAGEATVPLTRGKTTVVIKGVPAEICSNCGEYYLSEGVARQAYALADAAAQRETEVEIVRFAA
ncbi:MAG TPA: type II toxin-antitoxin system MqsA family antitoxin [Alphaproteobacteria bacterium]|jgi:YgiT-type zinc finger domain-containing protein|nr:type II toxin-antitoxin system MqsA family antitoxin [Alphaproteobacteria bacterium]